MDYLFFWASDPKFDRLKELDAKVPLTALFGDRSWIPAITTEELKSQRESDSYSKSVVMTK